MPKYVLPVVPKRVLDFSGLMQNTSMDIVLADRVDVVQWRELTVLLGVHGHSLGGGVGTITIKGFPQSVSDDEPGRNFIGQVPAFSILLDSTTKSPDFLSATGTMTGTFCLAPLARIIATGSKLAAGSMSATVSVQFSVTDE